MLKELRAAQAERQKLWDPGIKLDRQNTRAMLGISDTERADIALAGLKGKRLTYGSTQEAQAD